MKFEIGDIVKIIKPEVPDDKHVGEVGVVVGMSYSPYYQKNSYLINLLINDITTYRDSYQIELIKRGNTAMYREKLLMGEKF